MPARKRVRRLVIAALIAAVALVVGFAVFVMQSPEDEELDVILKDAGSFEMRFDDSEDSIIIVFSTEQPTGAEILKRMEKARHSLPFGRPMHNDESRSLVVKDAQGKELGRITLNGIYFSTSKVRYLTKGFSIEDLFYKEFDKQIKYYPSGKRKTLGQWNTWKRQGPWKKFYESGQVESEGNYDQGKRVGVWTFWREDGTVSHTIDYK